VASDPSESPEPASPSLSVRNFPFLEVSPPSANRCTWAAHVARQFPRAVASSLHVSDARVPTRAVRAGGLFPHSGGRQLSRGSIRRFLPIPSKLLNCAQLTKRKNRTLTQQAQTGGIERQRSATEWAICLTRFSVPLRRRTTARKTCLSMV